MAHTFYKGLVRGTAVQKHSTCKMEDTRVKNSNAFK